MDFLAGCLGGCAGVVVGHPLDTVKVHLQAQSSGQHNSTYQCLRKIVMKDGARGLYRGMSSPLVGLSGINAIIFGVYGVTQRHISMDNSIFSHFIAGGLAGLCQSILTCPMELTKSRSQIMGNISAWKCLENVYKMDGVRGVFRGFGVTICREVPAFASYFGTYEYLTRFEGGDISTFTMIMAGGTSGVVSWIISYPMDMVKTRMQLDGMNGTKEYRNSVDCCRKLVRKDGFKSLFRGVAPAVVRAFPVNAACFTVVTWTMRFLDGETPLVVQQHDVSLWEKYTNVVCNIQTPETAVA